MAATLSPVSELVTVVPILPGPPLPWWLQQLPLRVTQHLRVRARQSQYSLALATAPSLVLWEMVSDIQRDLHFDHFPESCYWNITNIRLIPFQTL